MSKIVPQLPLEFADVTDHHARALGLKPTDFDRDFIRLVLLLHLPTRDDPATELAA